MKRTIASVGLGMLLLAGSALAQPAPTHNLPPYPGSREHVGVVTGRAPASRFFYDQRSLVKSYVFKDHAAEAPEPLVLFAEPKSAYYMVARRDARSKETWPPVRVLHMKPGAKPTVWKIGALPPGTYMMRIVGAIPAADQVLPPKLMTIRFTINDRVDDGRSQYVLRARGVDNFYCVQEFGFHSVDGRELVAEVGLLDDSQTSLYAYNLEIHDILAGCAKAAGKTQPSFFTLEEREIARKAFAETDDGKKMLAVVKKSKPLSPELRRRRDDNLWNAVPSINAPIIENYWPIKGQQMSLKVDTQFSRDKGAWWMFNRTYGGSYGSGWDTPFALVLDEWGKAGRHPYTPAQTYTREDYLDHKPLGDTGDRGWGVVTDGTLVNPFARINNDGWEVYTRQLSAAAMDRYHLGGDEAHARDMSFALARYAWEMPIFTPYHSVKHVTAQADLPWLQNRFYQWKLVNDGFAMAYDKLFPFIQGNEELAQAVGRYIPSIKTPEHLIAMLDTHLVQYMAKNVLEGRYFYDNGTANILLDLAIVQADAKITEPWLDHMWTRGVYFYPIGHQPLPHVLSLNTQRDGTSGIGSFFYTNTGGPASEAAERIEPYMRLGGLAKFDLRDFNRYPEAIAGCYWPLEGPVAGMNYLGIGDVGGPSEPYGRRCDPAVNARMGWRWTKDPTFAWLLVNQTGRQYETDDEWAEVAKAAEGVPDPIMGKRSRALSDWSGILESGVGNPDFRFHSAAAVRVGSGYGHAHNDALDLRVWAHGLTMLGDFGQRGSYGKPTHSDTRCHNVALIDEDQQNGHSWISALGDLPGVQYVQTQAVPVKPGSLKRQTALIDVDAGTPSTVTKPQADMNVATPNTYVFDVLRSRGGQMHTFCFHGNVDDMGFEINVPEADRKVYPRDATPEREALEKADAEARFLADFRWTRPEYMGEAFRPNDADWAAPIKADVLQATWRLSRPAEKRMVGGDPKWGGAMTDPRKFTRLHLFNTTGLRALHGIVIDKENAANINPEFKHYAGRCVFVRKPGDQSVFVSLVEPYAGDAFILSRKTLPVQPADAGTDGPVAVEVVLAVRGASGPQRTDVLYADNTGAARTIPAHGIAVQGEFAVVQKSGVKVLGACLVRGKSLRVHDIEIAASQPEYRIKIAKVDYRTREVTLAGTVPAKVFKSATVEIGDAQRSTSYLVGEVFDRDGATVLKLPKSIEIGRTSVQSTAAAGGQTVIQTGVNLKAKAGEWAANADYSKLWRVVGSKDEDIVLAGAAAKADFIGESADIVTLEIGAGQDVVLPGRVSVTLTGDRYDVQANVPARVKLPGADWRALSAGEGMLPQPIMER